MPDPDPAEMKPLKERLNLVHTVDALRAAHPDWSVRRCCDSAKVSQVNYLRWKAAAEAPAAEAVKIGRPEKFAVTEADIPVLKWFSANTESMALAFETAAHYGPGHGSYPIHARCRYEPLSEPLRAAMLEFMATANAARRRWKNSIPASIAKHLRLSEAERNFLRGERASLDCSLTRHRVMIIREYDLAGQIVETPVLAGFIRASDDMSINQPMRSVDAGGEDVINRQTISTRDAYSLKWLGIHGVARDGDAYRAEDIADHFSEIVHAVGLPKCWRLERGRWECDYINGVRVPSDWSGEDGQRWGGLSDLFAIRRKFTPRGKGELEGGYRYVQSLLHKASTDIGRKRGDFERASKLHARAVEGDEEALAFFWDINEAMDTVWGRMAHDNKTLKQRHCPPWNGSLEMPDELWDATFTKRPIAGSDAWRLMPYKVCRVVTKACIYVSAKNYKRQQYQLTGADGFPIVENGTRVFVALDPRAPHEGAHIFYAETRQHLTQYTGLRYGQFVGIAPFVSEAYAEDLTGEGDFAAQKSYKAAVRSTARIYTPRGEGGGVVRVDSARDNLGSALSIVSGREPREKAARGQSADKPRERKSGGIAELLGTTAVDAWGELS